MNSFENVDSDKNFYQWLSGVLFFALTFMFVMVNLITEEMHKAEAVAQSLKKECAATPGTEQPKVVKPNLMI